MFLLNRIKTWSVFKEGFLERCFILACLHSEVSSLLAISRKCGFLSQKQMGNARNVCTTCGHFSFCLVLPPFTNNTGIIGAGRGFFTTADKTNGLILSSVQDREFISHSCKLSESPSHQLHRQHQAVLSGHALVSSSAVKDIRTSPPRSYRGFSSLK